MGWWVAVMPLTVGWLVHGKDGWNEAAACVRHATFGEGQDHGQCMLAQRRSGNMPLQSREGLTWSYKAGRCWCLAPLLGVRFESIRLLVDRAVRVEKFLPGGA